MKIKNVILANLAAVALLFILTTTLPINPKGEIFERKPVFEWRGLPTSYIVMIDDNPQFSTPTTAQVKGKTYTPENDLELGEHYWKVEGIRESKVQKFTITSKVSLKREEKNLRNDGNTKLNLDVCGTGAAVLDVNQTVEQCEGGMISAKQDE